MHLHIFPNHSSSHTLQASGACTLHNSTFSIASPLCTLPPTLHKYISPVVHGVKTPFFATIRINLEPTVITEQNKPGIHGRIPGRPTADSVACPACGLDLAASLLADGSKATTTGSLVILVTASSSAGGREQADKLERSASHVIGSAPVYAIAFRAADMAPALVTVTSRGRIFVIEEEEDNSRQLADIIDAFMTIKSDRPELLGGGGGPQKFYEHQVHAARPFDRIEGKLTVEDSLRRNLKVMAVTTYKEDIELFELVSPSGQVHKFPIVERGSVHFEFEESVEAGIWTYALKLAAAKSSPAGVAVSVLAYAEASADSTVSVSVWTSVEGGLAVPSASSPILIYAQVTEGQLPLSGASVVAILHHPGQQGDLGSTSSVAEVRLVDTGTGYPDTTAGDGIYSAYLTTFGPEPGFYSLVVRATDGGGSARIPTTALSPAQADSDLCCGSRYPVASTIPTPSFTRIVLGSSFYLTQGVPYFIRDGVPVMSDLFPPVRITDLHVGGSEATGIIGGVGTSTSGLETLLQWTAPGGDFNAGAPAARYEIRCYTGREALSEANFSRSGIPVHEVAVPTPGPAGTAETALVSLPWPNEVFYYGMVAIDEAGNRGLVSNLVAAFAREVVVARSAAANEDKAGGNGTTLLLSPGSSLPSTVLEVRRWWEDEMIHGRYLVQLSGDTEYRILKGTVSP